MSAQALKYLSFSGGSFSFLDSLTLRLGLTVVTVSVAIFGRCKPGTKCLRLSTYIYRPAGSLPFA